MGGVPGSNPGVPTTKNQAKPNPAKTKPRDFLAFAKVEATFKNPNVRFCEELRGFSFGHIFGHIGSSVPSNPAAIESLHLAADTGLKAQPFEILALSGR